MPDRAEIAIEKVEPMSTTKMIPRSARPNHRIAKGSQTMLGSDCKPSTTPPTVSSTHLHEAQAIPIAIPRMNEIE